MAEFNPSTPEISATNITGFSRGSQADTSAGTALKGVGDIVSGVTQVVDEAIKRDIQDQARETVHQSNTEIGVDSIVEFLDGEDARAGAELKNALNEMSSLQTAIKQGRINPLLYNARVDGLARSIRSKYPGYQNEIDAAISQQLGISTSANRIRDAIFGLAGKEDQGIKDVNSFNRWMVTNGHGPLPRAIAASGDINAAYEYASPLIKARTDLETSAKQFSLLNQMDSQDQREQKRTLGQFVNSSVNLFYQSQVPAIMELRKKFLADGTLDAGEQAQLNEAIVSAETLLQQTVLEQTNDMAAGIDGGTEIVRETFEKSWRPVRDLLEKGAFGVAQFTTTMNDADKKTLERQILQNYPQLQGIVGLSEIVPPQLMEHFFSSASGLQLAGDVVPAMQAIVSGNLSQGLSAIEDEAVRQSVARTVVDMLQGDIETSPETLKIWADKVFGEGGTDILTNDSREQLFKNLTTTAVVQNLKSNLSPAEFEKFEQYSQREASALMREALANVDNPDKLFYNTTTGKFNVVIQDAGESEQRGVFSVRPGLQENRINEQDARDLNTILKALNRVNPGDVDFTNSFMSSFFPNVAVGDSSSGGSVPRGEETGTEDELSFEFKSGFQVFEPESAGEPVDVRQILGADEEVATKFDLVVRQTGFNLPVISGRRTQEQQNRLFRRGTNAAKNSQHVVGKAIDVNVSGLTRDERIELIRVAKENGFTGFGVGTNTIHLDLGPARSWGYPMGKPAPSWAQEVINGG